jgi:hypothetical protein
MTYIEEIEAALAEAKEHLIREFGDRIGIHNALNKELTDLREKVLGASSRLAPQLAQSLTDWQRRVREEHDELERKYNRLQWFILDKADTVEHRELQLLKDQAEAMHQYLLVLKARIDSGVCDACGGIVDD